MIKGINEEDFINAINHITKKLVYKFRFGYHNVEDMKQQATIFALEALDKYDKSRPLENFLWTHIRNRLFNFKRDNYQRPDKPCLSCPLYDPHKQKSKSCCLEYEDKSNCDLYNSWFTRNNMKKNIMDTVNIDNITQPKNESVSFTLNIDNQEIIKLLDEKMPVTHRKTYLKLKYGNKIHKKDAELLVTIVKEIINGQH
jgi:DNA-directed RNA polymerase specialized sigma subunit